VLEMIGDAFVAFDADFNYTYVNEKAAALFGRKALDLVGRNYWQEFPEVRGTHFADAYVRALETGEPVQFEDHFERWDRWCEHRVSPSADGLAIFYTEITDRKRAEAGMRQLNLELERRVAERTARLQAANLSHPRTKGASLAGSRKGAAITPDNAHNEAYYARPAAELVKGQADASVPTQVRALPLALARYSVRLPN
jgi:PAS domain S-box-containing protein